MEKVRQILLEKLRGKNALWSFENPAEIDDDMLIEKVFLMLDIDDINILFQIFDKELLRKVWEKRILSQEPYYHGLNRLFAWFYFDINNPDDFISKRKIYSIN